jgi:hypothetical protein
VTTCEQCGFVYEEVAVDDVAGRVRALGPRYRELLGPSGPDTGHRPHADRVRPSLTTWSALEYACHVRDVLLMQRDRALVALVAECPSFPPMYREERVELARYEAQDLDEVAEQVAMAAELLALVFEGLLETQWQRPLIYNFPERTERDVAWLGRHTIHEGEHHLSDIRAALSRVVP